MKQVRIRINDLIDQHGANFGECPGCSICIEIHNLKDQLLEEPVDRFADILQKGQDMTRSDIVFLLENEVRKKEIRKALGMTTNLFTQMLKNFGLSFEKNMNPKGVEDMAKISLGEYQDLKAKGMADKDIADLKGMHPTYLSQMKKQWNISVPKARTLKTTPQASIEPKVALNGDRKIEKESEYETLIADLKTKIDGHEVHIDKLEKVIQKYSNKETEFEVALAQKDIRIMELEGSLFQAQNQIDYLNAACDDIENEADLKELERLRVKVSILEAEILPIRQLAYLKLKQDMGA